MFTALKQQADKAGWWIRQRQGRAAGTAAATTDGIYRKELSVKEPRKETAAGRDVTSKDSSFCLKRKMRPSGHGNDPRERKIFIMQARQGLVGGKFMGRTRRWYAGRRQEETGL